MEGMVYEVKEKYVKEIIIKDKTDKEKKYELVETIMQAKEDLQTAINNFEYAEENLIDYFLYQIKANQSKLDYLIKKAKKNNIEINFAESAELKNKKAI